MKNLETESIKDLIICNPYAMPNMHWRYERTKKKFIKILERRPAGYLIATKDSKAFDDPGEFRELELVNLIRRKVNRWRASGYPNTTRITKKLLEFWNEKERERRFFFCQIEAIETIIWFTEAREEADGIELPGDGGEFERQCIKMATGSGKTVVMAMLIAWQTLNKITYPKDPRYSKNVLIVTPGLTVKRRLKVLEPQNIMSYYEEFQIVPDSLYENLYRAKVIRHNWHTLKPIDDDAYSVIKKGKESNKAFAKRILRSDANNIIVINDEAHHAWRKILDEPDDSDEVEMATRWIEGLDIIHKVRNILKCYDFSATPFIPTGKSVSEETLFKWIISDFSLNDAIESGIAKTPRISIRDDSGKFDENYKSRFYHMYLDPEVKLDLNRKSKKDEPVPDLITNAYMLLGQDWAETKKFWDKQNKKHNSKSIPPVMVTVCNSTNTAARINYSFEKNRFGVRELSDPRHILYIDSTTLRNIEKKNDANNLLEGQKAEEMRQKINTVGKINTIGEQIRNVISVQMIQEGWDARNVTQIMGLRAFSSQLLCEQVVGRGLRRMSYDINPKTKLLEPEYVNIFGVPFTFLPHEGSTSGPPPPPTHTSLIEADPLKYEHEISWPNVSRIEYEYRYALRINWDQIKTLNLYSDKVSTTVGMAQVLEGKPHVDKMSKIDLYELNKKIRLQTIVFIAAKDVFNMLHKSWRGNKDFLIAQIVKLTEEFILKKTCVLDVPKTDELRTRMTIMFNMKKVVQRVCDAVREKNIEEQRIVLSSTLPIKSTSMMKSWHTKKDVEYATKNHINLTPYDSPWEIAASNELEQNSDVVSWVKNDHIGFAIEYFFNGETHKYYPDFIIKLKNNIMLVLEVKGRDNEQNKTKRKYLERWIEAVNSDGNYGTWAWDVVFRQTEVRSKIRKHMKTNVLSRTIAKCPMCGKLAKTKQEIEKKFGFRTVNGIIRPQSWCNECRSKPT